MAIAHFAVEGKRAHTLDRGWRDGRTWGRTSR